jgi:hypothetical protein
MKTARPPENWCTCFWNDPIDENMRETALKEWENERDKEIWPTFEEFYNSGNNSQYILSIHTLNDYTENDPKDEDYGKTIPQSGIYLCAERYDENGEPSIKKNLTEAETEEEVNDYLNNTWSILLDLDYAEKFANNLLKAIKSIKQRHKKFESKTAN